TLTGRVPADLIRRRVDVAGGRAQPQGSPSATPDVPKEAEPGASAFGVAESPDATESPVRPRRRCRSEGQPPRLSRVRVATPRRASTPPRAASPRPGATSRGSARTAIRESPRAATGNRRSRRATASRADSARATRRGAVPPPLPRLDPPRPPVRAARASPAADAPP